MKKSTPISAQEGAGSNGMDRRTFLTRGALAGAAMLPLVSSAAPVFGTARRKQHDARGDIAVLRFLAAAEILETDFWQQYAELANNNPGFNAALSNIDGDMPAYVQGNTDDEASHAMFLNQFLLSEHGEMVNLEPFRRLPSSSATGAQSVKRLTSLSNLNVDTSFYTRYRSSGNPDFGDSFPQIVDIVNRPGIPLHDGYSANQMQAIANTAAFHFAMIEQGGSSLYDLMSTKVNRILTLRIVTSIGGTEVAHFEIWNDKAGDTVPVDSGDGLVFPDLHQNTTFPSNHIFPRPCTFISKNLPLCSVIRPTSPQQVSAKGVVQFLTDTGLFFGQHHDFFDAMNDLAEDADEAMRHGGGDGD